MLDFRVNRVQNLRHDRLFPKSQDLYFGSTVFGSLTRQIIYLILSRALICSLAVAAHVTRLLFVDVIFWLNLEDVDSPPLVFTCELWIGLSMEALDREVPIFPHVYCFSVSLFSMSNGFQHATGSCLWIKPERHARRYSNNQHKKRKKLFSAVRNRFILSRVQ